MDTQTIIDHSSVGKIESITRCTMIGKANSKIATTIAELKSRVNNHL